MENFWQLLLHFDRYLDVAIPQYGHWTYIIISFIIFAEVGLVVTGILPGDSLLFAAGAIAARGTLDIYSLSLLLPLAAVAGNLTSYQFGYWLGPWLETRKNVHFFSHQHLLQAHHFFEKSGRWAVIMARFVPLIRTVAPLVAGMSKMDWLPFFLASVIGCSVWACSYLFAGFYFGNIPFVKQNFMLMIFGIVLVTLLPGLLQSITRIIRKIRSNRI